jgi:hypothetical protein
VQEGFTVLFIKMLLAGLPWAGYVRAKLSSLAGERGQDLIEYAIVGGLIAAIGVAALAFLLEENPVEAMFVGVTNCVDFDDQTDCSPGF